MKRKRYLVMIPLVIVLFTFLVSCITFARPRSGGFHSSHSFKSSFGKSKSSGGLFGSSKSYSNKAKSKSSSGSNSGSGFFGRNSNSGVKTRSTHVFIPIFMGSHFHSASSVFVDLIVLIIIIAVIYWWYKKYKNRR